MPWAGTLADCFRLPVELLTVIDIGRLLTSVEGARRFDALVEQAKGQGKAYLERTSERFAGGPVRPSADQRIAAELIIENGAADESTLIAMTTHGRSGLGRWLLGSVARRFCVARPTPCC
jgi:nucleotide-binding universal stress UspA family protein